MPEAIAATVPWAEILSGGGVGVALAMCWLFLKYLREQRIVDAEETKRKDETIERVTGHFSTTVQSVSTDVKEGLANMQETQVMLLKDSRDREAGLHALIREQNQNKA